MSTGEPAAAFRPSGRSKGQVSGDQQRSAEDLPMRDEAWARQRSAAARNHEAIARAAADLFRERGVDAVDVREIAQAAGVGVGTVYRRFGDKGSVIAAVLGDHEQELQDAVLTGPPPLGPGAPPGERLIAFLRALADLTEQNVDLLAASEGSSPGARFRIGAYRAWHLHVVVLLRAMRPELDHHWYADLLLAPLGAELYRHQRRALGMTPRRIVDNLAATVEAIASQR